MKQEEQYAIVANIFTKAWADEGFKQRLLSESATTLKEAGLNIPPGVEVRIFEDTDNVKHLVLPTKPASRELSEQELTHVNAGIFGSLFGALTSTGRAQFSDIVITKFVDKSSP